MKTRYCIIALIALLFTYCSQTEDQSNEEIAPSRVSLETTVGKIVIELSDKTPLHRDNFLKLAKEGTLDSLLFHRVIEGFVVQGGDPESKYAESGEGLGSGDLGYTVPAEFDSSLFHKRGAVGAARDGNPARASSAIQFYVVQAKKPIADSLFAKSEERINGWLRQHYSTNDPANQVWKDSLIALQNSEEPDWNAYGAINDTLSKLAEGYENFESYTIPENHRQVYREMGGTPFLDQNYTVFGEVVVGMDVIDSIAAMATDSLDRPIQDVRILKADVVSEK